ncbi:MAG TPA: glycoside hydrolase family 3 N-terminal domain-containing protein [Mycobacteriales bacterium]|nr:glycoside hydrolase family 3 N-terminal domain-containing protein [Mycobacteriales bacterium]
MSRHRSLRPPGLVAAASVAALTVAGLPLVASAAPAAVAAVRVAGPVALTAEGAAATVRLVLSTPTGAPLAAPVTVSYATGHGSATAGADYRAAAGTVTFPAGSAPGATRDVAVSVATDKAAETAETVPVTVTGPAGVDTSRATATVVIAANGLPYLNAKLPVAARVRDLLGRMTLAEKVGQMTQGERPAFAADPSLIATNLLGSVLSGGGSVPTPNTPEAWADMVDSFQAAALTTRLQIPILYGVDTVHGHGNLVGATIFPHNIGLGSSRDPALVERVEHVAASETRATGPQWAFAPCVCVARDTRWGRVYESFGEDPSLVIAMETSIDGLQGRAASGLARPDRVLASTKHFAGDGLTRYGTGSGTFTIDQGIDQVSRADFDRLALAPYIPAVQQHRTGTIMPSYSSVDFTDDGLGNPVKMHAERDLITGVLKGDIGFDGFVISDYNGIDQLPGDFADHVRLGVNAGIDMFMQPANFAQFEATLLDEVNAGRVSTARIDDAVSRILTKKFEMGLFERPFTPRQNMDLIGSAQHRAVARQAVAESQVLLRNNGNVLPLKRNAKVYVAGRNAENIGNQAGGWTVAWQGVSGDGVIPGTTILDGIRQDTTHVTYSEDGSAPTAGADVGVVVVGETPYSEGFGDVGAPSCNFCTPAQLEPKSLTLNPADSATVDRVCSAIAKCVVVVVSGRPQVFDDSKADALVASWLPGSEGEGVADVLFGKRPFTGRLSQTWPATADQEPINVGDVTYDPAFPYGWGLRTDPARARLVAARNSLGTADAASRAARADIAQALSSRFWTGNRIKDKASVVAALTRAAGDLTRTTRDPFSAGDRVVSVVRDLQQAVAVAGRAPANAAALSARADVQSVSGRPDQAIISLIAAGALR